MFECVEARHLNFNWFQVETDEEWQFELSNEPHVSCSLQEIYMEASEFVKGPVQLHPFRIIELLK